MPNPKLAHFNYLGSQNEVENSVVGNNGTDARATKIYNPGKFGNGVEIAATFPSAGDNVTIDSIAITPDGAIEIWVKLNGWSWSGTTASDGLTHIPFHTNAELTPLPREFIAVTFAHTTGILFDAFSGTGGNRLTVTSVSISADTLTHFSVCWSETQSLQKMFLDGVEKGSRASTLDFTTKISDLSIGKRDVQTTNGMKAVLDSVKVWSFFQTDFSKRERQRFGMNDSIVLV